MCDLFFLDLLLFFLELLGDFGLHSWFTENTVIFLMVFFILMPGCLVKNPLGFLSHDWSVHRQSLFFGGPFVHVNHRVLKPQSEAGFL